LEDSSKIQYLISVRCDMPKLSLLLFLVALVASCSRDSNIDPPKATFQYKVNGNLVIIKNISVADSEYILFKKTRWGTYSIGGYKGASTEMRFGIVSDSLTIGKYIYDSASASAITTWGYPSNINVIVFYNGQLSALAYLGDSVIINVTAYSNGYASGDFTAKLTPAGTAAFDYSKRGTTLITEGLFKNIPWAY
jgi:hypothetical protein